MRLGRILVGQGVITEDELGAALQRQRRKGGRLGTHLVALGALTVEKLMSALRSQPTLTETIELCERALENMRATYGEMNPNTSRARYNLARAYLAAGRAADASALAETALSCHLATLGSQHASTRASAALVAEVRSAVSRKARATAA